jgi:hypothetical protein
LLRPSFVVYAHADASRPKDDQTARDARQRDVLAATTPVSFEALRRIEFRQGRTFTMDEAYALAKTDGFEQKVNLVQVDFCQQPRNARVLACRPTQSRHQQQ